MDDDMTQDISTRKDPYFRMKLVIIIMIAVIIGLAVAIVYQSLEGRAMEKRHIAHMEKMKEQQTKLDRHMMDVVAYKDRLRITSLTIQKAGGVLDISGYIENTGKRPIGDLILTISFLDDDDHVIDQRFHTASDTGKSLKQESRRPFSFRIDNPPDNAQEILVIVTDIEFG
jgi:hypothetical protein